MGYVILQPFKNPYSLCQLELDFGIDLNKFSEEEIDNYRYNNKGRLVELVKNKESRGK